mmetsp:Transcript_4696/g.8003  ORF Transcript_4696/g.8003 Transcript_4696/m.8003 type:complete len:99 (+) Transcript_4696:168-464(+)
MFQFAENGQVIMEDSYPKLQCELYEEQEYCQQFSSETRLTLLLLLATLAVIFIIIYSYYNYNKKKMEVISLQARLHQAELKIKKLTKREGLNDSQESA